jgi:AcrR family transcriptional regulator
MTTKRLTRQESRDQTRQQLLDAAQKLVAEQGLAATSVEDIASEAGFTRGAFYSNFSDKNALFIELLRRDHEQSIKDFKLLFSGEVPQGELRQQVRTLFSRVHCDDCSFMNWAEARLLAVRDPDFRLQFSALEEETRCQIAGFIDTFYRLEARMPPADSKTLALGLISLIEGVQLYMLSTPEPDSGAVEQVLGLFIDGLMA